MRSIVLVVCHKPCEAKSDGMYRTIGVGPNKDSLDVDLRDDGGQNIAWKNPSYCELTAQYWAWKNLDRAYGYVGLCHYRRYFARSLMHRFGVLDEASMGRYLSGHDIILPTRWSWGETVYEKYFVHGNGREKDLKALRQVITDVEPSYVGAFDEHMESRSGSYCNMFITDRVLFDQYSSWLFDILAEVEDRVDTRDYSAAEARIFGYMSELLVNVWVRARGLHVKYLPMIETERSVLGQVRFDLSNAKRRCSHA